MSKSYEQIMSDTFITIPGDIPNLLRVGSPVLSATTEVDCHGVVYSLGDRWIRVAYPPYSNLGNLCFVHENLVLDLTDATGRVHAAWWLARRVGASPDDATAAVWCRQDDCWVVVTQSGWVEAYASAQKLRCVVEVPTLAALNPSDPRRLPDGSRWVDAEALRRVVLHAAGREVN